MPKEATEMELVTEAELKAKAKKPRITFEMLDANIKDTAYLQHGLLTICVLTLQNGFMVTGESACADEENFDLGVGQRLAFHNARNQIWKFMGYELKTQLHQIVEAQTAVPIPTPKDRVVEEWQKLLDKLTKLREFLLSSAFDDLAMVQKLLLTQQEKTMAYYLYILEERLDNWE
jgi:Phage protein (N4 Gp49/phage Sf6 gene 66) family